MAQRGKNKRRSGMVAFGGVLSGIAVVVLLLSAVFPTAEYALPAIAGVLLMIMVIEYGYKSAMLCYAAVAILSLILVPNKEAAVLFAAFFGYYPIIKGKIETGIKNKLSEWLIKLFVFNAAILISVLVSIYLLGITDAAAEFRRLGDWWLLVFLLLGNAVFVLFDRLLTQLVGMYYQILKPKLIDKLKLH